MGFTHYLEQKRAFTQSEWDQITKTVKAMFFRCKQVAGGDGTGRPVVDDTEICFNGVGDEDSHETCQITKAKYPGFNFCKTARKPYDRYVVATLVICNYFAPGALDIGSDGCVEEWGEGLEVARVALEKAGTLDLSRNPIVPPGVRKTW